MTAEEEFHKWMDEDWPLWRVHQGSTHYFTRQRTLARRHQGYYRAIAWRSFTNYTDPIRAYDYTERLKKEFDLE
jgi:hypothetical protein